ncbi:MAG: ATP synthase F1 subunit delta [Polyangiaceae bacterium]
MSTIVATRYARALYELGSETSQLEALSNEIARLAEVYAGNPELRDALDNPLVTHASRRAVVGEIAEKLSLSPLGKNTALLLLDRRRIRFLPAISQRLREMSDLQKGIVRAEVTTAAPLSETFYQRLEAQLAKMTGKKVTLDRKQDPSIIGGVITRIGDTLYDGSLKSRLESLKTSLLPN